MKVVAYISEKVGPVEIQEAEYHALIEGLKLALRHHPDDLQVFTDSAIVADQIRQEAPRMKSYMKPLHVKVRQLLAEMGEHQVRISWLPRELNREADQRASDAFFKPVDNAWVGRAARSSSDSRWRAQPRSSVSASSRSGSFEPFTKRSGARNWTRATSPGKSYPARGSWKRPSSSQRVTAAGPHAGTTPGPRRNSLPRYAADRHPTLTFAFAMSCRPASPTDEAVKRTLVKESLSVVDRAFTVIRNLAASELAMGPVENEPAKTLDVMFVVPWK
jgi:ribonuclease HI